jgi:hypothetical protein
MSEVNRNEKGFIGYEYKEATVSRKMEAIYSDSYSHFGWTLEGITPTAKGPYSVTMSLKRDRKIKNKAELTRLQRKFESCVKELERLENSKVIKASTMAYSIGVIGTAFLAGSVFGYTANMLPLSIILAIPGFAGWVIPYFAFTQIHNKKSGEVAPLIEQQYDAIYDVCENANALLSE